MINNIEDVFNEGLCCNCGTCEGLCPQNAVKIEINDKIGCYEPYINKKICNNCQLCLNVCPGFEVDFKSLNLEIFDREQKDILIGNYRGCYLGHCTNNSIRYDASSGGIISALLIFALENGLINGALVTRMKKDNPLKPEPFIARTKEEIIEASKSKYCPVSLNIMLKEILKADNGEKFAVVGLPCHIHGIRKAEKLNKILKGKIVLHLGIFCSHTDTFWQTEFLIKKLNIKKEYIDKINYRGKGWPGNMSIQLKDNSEILIPYNKAIVPHTLWINSLFRCLFCCDLTAELADISCGDPWFPEVMSQENLGKSIIINRTKDSEKILLKAIQENYIEIEKISPEKVYQSGYMMQTKKRDVNVRFLIRKIFKKSVPHYNLALLKPGIKNYLRGIFVYLNSYLSSKKRLKRVTESIWDIELWIKSF